MPCRKPYIYEVFHLQKVNLMTIIPLFLLIFYINSGEACEMFECQFLYFAILNVSTQDLICFQSEENVHFT